MKARAGNTARRTSPNRFACSPLGARHAATATDPCPASIVPDVKPIIAAAQRTGANKLPTAPGQVELIRPFLDAGAGSCTSGRNVIIGDRSPRYRFGLFGPAGSGCSGRSGSGCSGCSGRRTATGPRCGEPPVPLATAAGRTVRADTRPSAMICISSRASPSRPCSG